MFSQTPSVIAPITSVSRAIANPRQGDWIFFDIDELLIHTGFNRFGDEAKLTEASLAADIKFLREVGVHVVGLTARTEGSREATVKQLSSVGIELDTILHAPNIHHEDQTKTPTKGKVAKKYLEEQATVGRKPKRVFAFDDVMMNLGDIAAALEEVGIPFYGKHYQPVHQKQIKREYDSADNFPANLDGYVKVKALDGGSKSVYELQHKETGHRLVIKFGSHEDSAKLEILCNAVYEAIGVPVPKMRAYHVLPKALAKELNLTSPYGVFKVCEYIQKGKSSENDIIEGAKCHYVAHALMGNIDVAKPDNFIVDENGIVHLIDAGANFIFKSMGKPREEAPELASEIETLKSKDKNSTGAKWFVNIDDEEIANQLDEINKCVRVIEEAVWQASNEIDLSDELRAQFIVCLSDRLDVLNTRYIARPQAHAKHDKKARKDETAAGILTYALIDNIPHVLLSKRVRHEWWDNFGGKSDPQDKYLLDTARREVKEESNNLFDYSEYDLADAPSHDIITGKRERQFNYRMYIAKHLYVDPASFHDYEHTQHQWVPVSEIVKALKSDEYAALEGEMVKVVHADKGDIYLYPPLCQMLAQAPVLEQLEMLCETRQLKRRHTLGYADETIQPASAYRPLSTTRKKQADLAAHMMKKSKVLKKLKRERKSEEDINQRPLKKADETTGLSPSEIHMKSLLGKDYVANDVRSNVERILTKYFNKKYSEEEKNKLIDGYTAMITAEINHPDSVHFYHGCNNEASFAYDVYSALYKEIYANDDWKAFRMDTPHLRKFRNIAELIAYYSDNGQHQINNNDADFQEAALSLNLFLFGNHDNSTSCSVEYMMKNMVMRGFNLDSMLSQLFAPFHASPQWMSRLQRLFKDYASKRKGAMYQISISKADANEMAYPAGSMGVIKTNNDQGDISIVKVIDDLQAETASGELSTKSAKYIARLQARLLAAPSIPMRVQELRLTDMQPEDNQNYNEHLNQLMNELVYQLHMHAADKHPSMDRGVHKVFPHVLQQNLLPHQAGLSDEYLLALINSNDVARLGDIIADDPDILNRKVRDPRNIYMNDDQRSHNTDAKTVLERIAVESTITAAQLGGVFEQRLREYTPHNSGDMVAVIKKLRPEHRYEYVGKHIDKYDYRFGRYGGEFSESDIRDLTEICGLLNEEGRVSLFRKYEKMIKPFEYKVIIDLFALMPDHIRNEIFTKISDQIKNAKRLHIALGILPEADRLAVLAQYESLLLSKSERKFEIQASYAGIVGLLPVQNRLEFALKYQEFIDDGYQLKKVMGGLDEASRPKLLAVYQGEIKSSDLTEVLELLPPAARCDAAIKHKKSVGEIYSNMVKILELLPEADRYRFASACADKINLDNIASVLDFMPQNRYLKLMQDRYQSCVEGYRYAFELRDVAAKFTSYPKHIIAAYRQFVIAGITAYSLFKTQPSKAHRLAFALWMIPEAERLPLVKQHEAVITEFDELIKLSHTLNKTEFLWVAERHQDLIKHGAHLHDVVRHIPDQSRLKFMLQHLEKLNVDVKNHQYEDQQHARIDQLVKLLELEDERLAFIRAYVQHGVHQENQLFAVLELLPHEEQYSCLMNNITAAADSWSFRSLLEFVPDDKKIEFYRAFAVVTTKQENLLQCLKNIPEDERLFVLQHSVCKLKFDRYDNGFEKLSEFINLLSKIDQEKFADSIVPADVGTLVVCMHQLAQSKRLEFALKYYSLADSIRFFDDILIELSTEEDRKLVVEKARNDIMNGTIQTYNLMNIALVIKYMPEDDRLAYLNKFSKFVTDEKYANNKNGKKHIATIMAALPEKDRPALKAMLEKRDYYQPDMEKPQPSYIGDADSEYWEAGPSSIFKKHGFFAPSRDQMRRRAQNDDSSYSHRADVII